MSKKTNPKILILTQIHPVNVSFVYDEISRNFLPYNEVFSPQVMALLGELSLKEGPDDLKHSYRVLNAAFVKNINAAIKKMSPLRPWIFIGNCRKGDVKFDHIIGFDGGETFGNANNFDLYIKKDNEMLSENNLQINYYTKEDAEYFFPTLDHLQLFLTTIGLKKGNTKDDTVQPSTT
jgi:hypothetical protein